MRVTRMVLLVVALCGLTAAVRDELVNGRQAFNFWSVCIATFLNSAWIVALLLINAAVRIKRPSVAIGGLIALFAGEFLVDVTYSDPILRYMKPFGQALVLFMGAGLVALFVSRGLGAYPNR